MLSRFCELHWFDSVVADLWFCSYLRIWYFLCDSWYIHVQPTTDLEQMTPSSFMVPTRPSSCCPTVSSAMLPWSDISLINMLHQHIYVSICEQSTQENRQFLARCSKNTWETNLENYFDLDLKWLSRVSRVLDHQGTIPISGFIYWGVHS